MFSGHERLGTAFSADRLVRAQFVHSQRQVIGAEMNLLSSESRHRVYATHFILSFLRFFAQSTR
jgi:hypothetical protein